MLVQFFKSSVTCAFHKYSQQVIYKQQNTHEAVIMVAENGTVNPLYNGIRYTRNRKIRCNVNSVFTKTSRSCFFTLTVPCYSFGKQTFWTFVRIASPRLF